MTNNVYTSSKGLTILFIITSLIGQFGKVPQNYPNLAKLGFSVIAIVCLIGLTYFIIDYVFGDTDGY